MRVNEMDVICDVCGRVRQHNERWARYCSEDCRREDNMTTETEYTWNGEKMTSEVPTEPGWYWGRRRSGTDWEIVQVEDRSANGYFGGLHVFVGITGCGKVSMWHEWGAKIPEPERVEPESIDVVAALRAYIEENGAEGLFAALDKCENTEDETVGWLCEQLVAEQKEPPLPWCWCGTEMELSCEQTEPGEIPGWWQQTCPKCGIAGPIGGTPANADALWRELRGQGGEV